MKKFFCFINFDRLRRAATLYVTFFKIALLVVGGGYAIIAAAQEEFVTRRRWITDDEMLDVITVTQTVPGIIACNSAVCIGWRIAGVVGALAAALGAITPSVAIIALIAAGM
ncbi:MAG: chromate transporter, partial [Victivallaceae bacterium]|nr:chromate transporter [Victivallaceae bacterium]